MRSKFTMGLWLCGIASLAFPKLSQSANRLRAEWERTEYVVIGYHPFAQSITSPHTTGGYDYNSQMSFWKTATKAILDAGSKLLILRSNGIETIEDFYGDLRLMGLVDAANQPVSGVVIDTARISTLEPTTPSIWVRDRFGTMGYKDEVGERVVTNLLVENDEPILSRLGIAHNQLDFKSVEIFADGGNILSDGMGRWIADPKWLTEIGATPAMYSNVVDQARTGLGVTDLFKGPEFDIHVDYHTKLIDEETMLVSDHFPELKTFWKKQTASTGNPYRVISVPESPVVENFGTGVMAGSYYVNSLIVNNTVLVGNASMEQRILPNGTPLAGAVVDNSAFDTTAIQLYRKMFPGYKIVMLPQSLFYHSVLGSIHCLTNEIGDANPVYVRGTIHHEGDTLTHNPSGLAVQAVAKSAAGIKNVKLWWKKDNSPYAALPMTAGTNNTYNATIPYSTAGREQISYYFEVTDNRDKTEMRPFVGSAGGYTFQVAAANGTTVATNSKPHSNFSIIQNSNGLEMNFESLAVKEIKIFDLRGQMILHKTSSESALSIPWSSLGTPKILIVQIATVGENSVMTTKIMPNQL